jgi:hypothetical protein
MARRRLQKSNEFSFCSFLVKSVKFLLRGVKKPKIRVVEFVSQTRIPMLSTRGLVLGLVVSTFVGCHKRSRIAVEADPVNQSVIQDGRSRPPDPAAIPASNPEWKEGNPTALLGNWASSLFQDQRCTVFYSFASSASLELNIICLNNEKKRVERETRTFTVAQYPGSPQLRFRPIDSSCQTADGRDMGASGSVFLYVVEERAAAGQSTKLAIWEPNVGKVPLNLSRSDGIMADGFPGKTGTYLGLPVVTGCFKDGVIASFTENSNS